jgi:hypothetical protein
VAERYAARTDVSADRTRSELERLLVAHGATGFGFGWDSGDSRQHVVFRLADRMIKLTVPVPDPADPAIYLTPTGRRRSKGQIAEQVQAEFRRRWRSLLLVTKARLVAVQDGVQTLEEAFMADVILPDGSTVGEWLHPQLDTAYATAEMPSLLPGTARQPALERGP